MDNSSDDTITETATTGWRGRPGRSIFGMFLGILLIPAATVLLYWNEGRAVAASSALDRSLRQVEEASPNAVLPGKDGKLIHLVGQIAAATSALDPAFAVTGHGLLRLRRSVEMYQWKEDESVTTQRSIGGSQTTQVTYSYHRVWSERAIDSGAFHHMSGHVNPVMPMRSITFDTPAATLGAYDVDPSVLDEISDFTPLAVTKAPPLPAYSSPFYPARSYRIEAGGFYLGQNPANPSIGDLRVTFEAVRSQFFSVVAAQVGNALAAYHAADRHKIALVEPGAFSAAALFSAKKQEERMLAWVLRGAGFALMVVAFALLAAPLVALFAVIPFFEGIMEAGAFVVALTFAVPVTLLTIAVAWAAHRPLVGGALLVAAAISLFLLPRLHRGPRADAAAKRALRSSP